MGFWKRFFGFEKKQPKKTVKETLQELTVGDLVAVKFKSPDQIGIVSKHDLALTRLNPKEASQRKIQGSVTRLWKDKGIKAMFLEVATYSSPDMPGQLRKMIFLEDEIETVRKIDE